MMALTVGGVAAGPAAERVGMRRVVILALILVLSSAWPAIPMPAARLAPRPVPEIETAVHDAIRHLDLQTTLPGEAEPPRRRLSIPPELIWAVFALAAALGLYGISDQLPILRLLRRDRWEAPAEAGESGSERPADARATADDLAAEGRFVEAMHVLLLQSLRHIRSRLGIDFADSLTSREILRSTALSAQGRDLLGAIVGRVEWSYFGGHPAGRSDYAACRHSFDALAVALDADRRA
jgi:hypothetical protein